MRGSMAPASSQTTAGDEQTPGFSEQAVWVQRTVTQREASVCVKRKGNCSRPGHSASRAGEEVLVGVAGKPAWTCAQVVAGDEGES